MDISVIGCGYLGAVHAACLASLGHRVIGVEQDPERAIRLDRGDPVFFEPGFAEILQAASDNGFLRFTSDPGEAATCRVHFVCVGTPQSDESGTADLGALDAAVAGLLPHLHAGDLVVGKSTVPVGTARRLADHLRSSRPDVSLAWNPEFLREGTAVRDTLHPDRLVYGIDADTDEPSCPVSLLDAVYAEQLAEGTPRMITDYATAELVKVAANSFLATKISFINAMADVCDRTGGDVRMLADALGHDARIGRQFLDAGLGFGGGCLPKDIRAFRSRADELGAATTADLLRHVDRINLGQPVAAAQLAEQLLGGSVAGRRVTILGATFKPDSDDIRESPGLAIATVLQERGARVVVTDPQGTDNARKSCPELDLTDDLHLALTGADALLLATGWQDYRDLDPDWAADLVAERLIIDGRNVIDAERWSQASWTVAALGRPTPRPGGQLTTGIGTRSGRRSTARM